MVLVLFWGKKGIGLSSVWFKLVFVWFGSSRRLLLSSVYILTSSFCQSINVYLIIIRGYKYVKDKIQNLLFISGDCGHVDYTVLYSILAQFFFKLISCSSRMSLFFKYWTETNKSLILQPKQGLDIHVRSAVVNVVNESLDVWKNPPSIQHCSFGVSHAYLSVCFFPLCDVLAWMLI